ncbi:hypothetical protein [Listeria fleischmannii]|nr:hypothetical protein [Listeria fleischmannii]
MMQKDIKYTEVQHVINSLILVLKKYASERMSYQINQLELVEEILHTEESVQEKNRILNTLMDRIYQGPGSLTEFYVFDEDDEKRAEINKPIGELIFKLWDLVRN